MLNARRGVLFALVAVAIAVRLWAAHHVHVVSNDAAAVYLYQAQEILRGNWREGMGSTFPPGYPLLISLAALLPLELDEAGKLVSVLCGGLLVLPVFALGLRLYGRREAWIAAALAVVDPLLIGTARDAMTEAPFTLLLALTAWAGADLMRAASAARSLAAGGLLGLAYLVRPEAAGFLLVFMAVVVAARAPSGKGAARLASIRERLPLAAWIAAGFLTAALPYLLFLRAETGRWTLSGKTMMILSAFDVTETGERVDYEAARYTLAPDGERLAWQDGEQGAAAYLWESRFRQMLKYARNAAAVYLRYLPGMMNPVLWFLAAIALALGPPGAEGRRRDLYLGSFFLFPLACYPLLLVEGRYFAPLVPIGILWASRGLTLVDDALAGAPAGPTGRRAVTRVVAVAAAIVLATSAWPVIGMVRERPDDYPAEHRTAGEWLRRNGRPHPRILSRKALVASYARGVPVPLPVGAIDQILAYARAQEVDYLVVDERYTAARRPALRGLLEDGGRASGLKPIYTADGPGRRLIIFELQPQAP
jgi:4-amino-4-deoxy-L-arabinose transferase-like glycosyltransferase